MKRKTLIFLFFLLVLYIVPSNLIGSSDVTARQNEPNLAKDFLPSSYYNTTEQVAYAGTDDWADSKVKDLVYWSTGGIQQEFAYFNFSVVQGGELIGFQYVCRNSLFEPNATLEVYNGTGYTVLFTITYGSKWNNDSYFGDLPEGETITIRQNSQNSGAGAFVDYLALKFVYATWETAGEAELSFDTPSWNIIVTVIVKFVAELFTGSFDAFIIFLGLCMIPGSTLYLAKGGKKELSANKVFYFIIAFMLGWGLLLGGIM